MNIQPATFAHLHAIHAVECECFSDPWSLGAFSQDLNNIHIIALVAMDEEQPVPTLAGYTFMRHLVEDGHIDNIAVAPAYRRMGVASLLMKALLCEAKKRGMEKITLEVRQGNRAAMALYHKYGFIPVGYRRNFYRDPNEDAVIMQKQYEVKHEA